MRPFKIVDGGKSKNDDKYGIKANLTRLLHEKNPGKLTLREKKIWKILQESKPITETENQTVSKNET